MVGDGKTIDGGVLADLHNDHVLFFAPDLNVVVQIREGRLRGNEDDVKMIGMVELIFIRGCVASVQFYAVLGKIECCGCSSIFPVMLGVVQRQQKFDLEVVNIS